MEPNNKITLKLNKPQEGEIKVHSQIINDLSSGIYSSPASCIKELVNNSYDADASLVNIRIKPIDDTIIVIDNGTGMNAKDFDNNFAWISKSNKRNSKERSEIYNRPLIGKIGIGFIAVNEICHSLKVTSSKKGESIKFEALIDFNKIIENNDSEDIIKGTYTLINEEEDKDVHYTIIQLIDLKDSVIDILNDKQYHSNVARSKNKDFDTKRYNDMKEIITHIKSKKLKTFKEENAYTQFILDLSSYIPVQYIDDGPIKGHKDKIIESIVKEIKNYNFKVDLDGIYLKKPIFFDITDGQRYACVSFNDVIEVGEDDSLEVRGYFFSKGSLLTPREINGVAIRVRGIPIAIEFGYDTTLMSYPNYVDQIFRNWVTGEIYVTGGLEEAMNIDRKSFRITHPKYLALQNYLHKFLREKLFSKDVKSVYSGNKVVRDEKKRKANNERKKKILNKEDVKIEIKKNDGSNSDSNPVIITETKSVSTVTVNQSFRNKFKKSDWASIEDILIIFEKAYSESKGNSDELRKIFYSLITELKGK